MTNYKYTRYIDLIPGCQYQEQPNGPTKNWHDTNQPQDPERPVTPVNNTVPITKIAQYWHLRLTRPVLCLLTNETTNTTIPTNQRAERLLRIISTILHEQGPTTAIDLLDSLLPGILPEEPQKITEKTPEMVLFVARQDTTSYPIAILPHTVSDDICWQLLTEFLKEQENLDGDELKARLDGFATSNFELIAVPYRTDV